MWQKPPLTAGPDDVPYGVETVANWSQAVENPGRLCSAQNSGSGATANHA